MTCLVGAFRLRMFYRILARGKGKQKDTTTTINNSEEENGIRCLKSASQE
jgi:hypothetical protein